LVYSKVGWGRKTSKRGEKTGFAALIKKDGGSTSNSIQKKKSNIDRGETVKGDSKILKDQKGGSAARGAEKVSAAMLLVPSLKNRGSCQRGEGEKEAPSEEDDTGRKPETTKSRKVRQKRKISQSRG